MRFNLKTLAWAVTCCAIAAWLVTLPSLVVAGYGRTDPKTGEHIFWEEPVGWPLDVAVRIGFATAVFFLAPRILGRFKTNSN